MTPLVGIDLGTTFSCMSYLNENGVPEVIKNSDGQTTTPSVIYFDGKQAHVGDKAIKRKLLANAPIWENFKRDIGQKIDGRYVSAGFDYRAVGFSAILLKKLKIEAYNFFKIKDLVPHDSKVNTFALPAVITVPASFTDQQKLETKQAGIAAGFDVISIINEPTAAAITYGINLQETQKILVFDLGGGTLDVTIMQTSPTGVKVICSDGHDQTGGKDWDYIIESYIRYQLRSRYPSLDTDGDMFWEIQSLAVEAKKKLTDNTQTTINIIVSSEPVDMTLYRENPDNQADDFSLDLEDNSFYFEEQANDKLTLCKNVLNSVLKAASLTWADIDEVVLAGGSSRMPMIPKMIGQVSGKKIKKNISGFDYDTAISFGATIYGHKSDRVVDVSSNSFGIKVSKNNREVIAHLIKKNTPLPVEVTEIFQAEQNAILIVYEGEETSPDRCEPRGKIELNNTAGEVKVFFRMDSSGLITVSIESNGSKADLKINSSTGDVDVSELKAQIEAIDIKL